LSAKAVTLAIERRVLDERPTADGAVHALGDPDEGEPWFLVVGQPQMRPGCVAKNGHDSVWALRDPVRVDHIRREGIEIASTGSFVLITAGERRFV
jgi:hypothetical protein